MTVTMKIVKRPLLKLRAYCKAHAREATAAARGYHFISQILSITVT